jgi:hypothetical protein
MVALRYIINVRGNTISTRGNLITVRGDQLDIGRMRLWNLFRGFKYATSVVQSLPCDSAIHVIKVSDSIHNDMATTREVAKIIEHYNEYPILQEAAVMEMATSKQTSERAKQDEPEDRPTAQLMNMHKLVATLADKYDIEVTKMQCIVADICGDAW